MPRKKVKNPDKTGSFSHEIHDGEVDFSHLDELMGFELRRAQQKIFQHFQNTVGQYGITPGQAGVLILISNNPAISQANLARAIGVERATLGETIDYLQGKQWVERRNAPSDARSYALYLTKPGMKFINTLLDAIHVHEKQVSANLTTREYRQLLDLLIKFNKK